jgi:type II secretory pathway predicted ATPase ExeA
MIDKVQSYYGFTTMPFGKRLAPSQLHRHHSHAQAVARIGFTITSCGIALICGEAGAGKTVAARAAIAGLDQPRHRIIYLPNPTTGARGICHQIVTALGGVPRFQNAALFPQAAEALVAENTERGRQPVLVIDEAHLLDHRQLELVRMLTNTDMDSTSPLACILVGQPTLRRNLKLGILAALDQRISTRYTLEGMTRDETASYLSHHLSMPDVPTPYSPTTRPR